MSFSVNGAQASNLEGVAGGLEAFYDEESGRTVDPEGDRFHAKVISGEGSVYEKIRKVFEVVRMFLGISEDDGTLLDIDRMRKS